MLVNWAKSFFEKYQNPQAPFIQQTASELFGPLGCNEILTCVVFLFIPDAEHWFYSSVWLSYSVTATHMPGN